MESFEDFFKIYTDNNYANLSYYMMDALLEKINTTPTTALRDIINYYINTVQVGPGKKEIYDAFPELYAYIIWIQVYLGHNINIYTTDSLNFEPNITEDDEPEEVLPRYMDEAFTNPEDMFQYVFVCTLYAITSRNIPVLEQTLRYNGILEHIQHHFILTKLMMSSKPDKTFLSYMKDKIFKNETRIQLTQYPFNTQELEMLIDLDFRFLLTALGPALSHISVPIENWDLFFGLRDFPLFDEGAIRTGRVYYVNAGGLGPHYDEMIREWRAFYQTPERKIRILDTEEAIRNVKMELNDLMHSYNSLAELGIPDNLVLRDINNNIEETKLRLHKLEQELSI